MTVATDYCMQQCAPVVSGYIHMHYLLYIIANLHMIHEKPVVHTEYNSSTPKRKMNMYTMQ